MAHEVTVAQVGQSTKTLTASTVKEALADFGLEGDYQVKLNGAAADMSASIPAPDSQGRPAFLTIGEKVKGGL